MIFGIIFVCYLVYLGNIERLAIIILTVYACFFIRTIKTINMRYITIIMLGVISGFMLASYSLFFFEYRINECLGIPNIQYKYNDNTAVLLIFNGEPEKYDLPLFLNNFSQKDQNAIYKMKAPWRLYGYKKAYEFIGASRYTDISMQIYQSLSKHLNYGYDVYLGYVYNKPYYHEILRRKISKRNYNKIIIVPIYISESLDYKRILQFIENESLHFPNSNFKFMSPLWDSCKIGSSILQEVCTVNENMAIDEVGIIFIVSKTEEKSKNFSYDYINQEQAFTKRLKTLFIENRFEDRKIKWVDLEPLEDEIQKKIEELQQYGIKRIYLIYVMDIEDKIYNQYRIKKMIQKNSKLEEIEIKYIKGWGFQEGFIEELEYRIRLMNVGG